MKVSAVVVTYNRKELFRECLEALLNQSYVIDTIIVIDNASTDGTYEMILDKGYLNNKTICYKKMSKNTGGAGGFYYGIKEAYETQSDWVWIMDDDTIPESDALEKLIDKAKKNTDASFFASCVKGTSGEPMNVPSISKDQDNNGYPNWYMKLSDSLVKIESATFVSLLINNKAIKKCGLPCKEFFIWGDDIEYTTRLTRNYGSAYLVGDSWACHKRANAKALNICTETDAKRINNYHYAYRNGLIINALYSKRPILVDLIIAILKSFKLLLSGKGGLKRFAVCQKGIFEFIFQHRRFLKIIKDEMSV